MNRFVQIIFVLIIAIFIASCMRTYTIVTPFDEREHSPYLKDGNSTIYGQAFLKYEDGGARFAPGATVSLIPATSYSKEMWQASARRELVAEVDPRWHKYVRKVIADGSGRYVFDNIPEGDYLVECSILYAKSRNEVIVKEIKVKRNEKIRLMLTQ